ncbi:MAG: hypothetical protein P1P80_01480 [ANME-2 cluster archaeon]|nr:hypothetical protein [ANME-2 cluster archaeon]
MEGGGIVITDHVQVFESVPFRFSIAAVILYVPSGEVLVYEDEVPVSDFTGTLSLYQAILTDWLVLILNICGLPL